MLSSAGATLINLGAAAGYQELSVTGSITLSGPSGVFGNVGVAGGGSVQMTNDVNLSGGSFVTGEVDLHTGDTFTVSGGSWYGSMSQNSATNTKLANAVSAIQTLSQELNSATYLHNNFGLSIQSKSISDSTQTLNLAKGNYVFSLSKLNLSGGHILTINAPAGSQIVFDISGALTLSGNSEILLKGGITSDDVFYNVMSNDPNNAVSISPGYVEGIIYAANGGASIGPPITNGLTASQVLAYGNIVTHSGGQVCGNGNLTPVPEASAILPLVVLLGLAGGFQLRRRWIVKRSASCSDELALRV
jgi:hypothetical protein